LRAGAEGINLPGARYYPERDRLIAVFQFDSSKEHAMFEGLFQPTHLLLILGIAVLFFGPKKLPELGKGIGESIRGFKSAMKDPDKLPEKTAPDTSAQS